MLGLLFVNINNNNGFSCEEGGEEFLFLERGFILLFFVVVIALVQNKLVYLLESRC